METRRNLVETKRSEDVMLAYLEAISKRLDNVELNSKKHEETCKKLLVELTERTEVSIKALCTEQKKQGKYFFAGRIAFLTFTSVAICFWWLVENSHTLSDLYFNFIDGAKNDHTGHSK